MKLEVIIGVTRDLQKKVEAFVNRKDVEIKHMAVQGFKTMSAIFLLWEKKKSEDNKT